MPLFLPFTSATETVDRIAADAAHVAALDPHGDRAVTEGLMMDFNYVKEVMADSPISWWRLQEAGGTVARDFRNRNAGSYQTGVTLYQTGPLPGGRSVAIAGLTGGNTGHISVPHSTTLNVGDVFTLEIWVNGNGTAAGGGLMSKGSSAFGLQDIGSNGSIRVDSDNVAAIATSTVAYGASPAGWHHIVWTKNAATNVIYIDKVDRTGVVTNATLVNTSTALTIGKSLFGGQAYYNGLIAEPAIYATALSAARVAAHFDARPT